MASITDAAQLALRHSESKLSFEASWTNTKVRLLPFDDKKLFTSFTCLERFFFGSTDTLEVVYCNPQGVKAVVESLSFESYTLTAEQGLQLNLRYSDGTSETLTHDIKLLRKAPVFVWLPHANDIRFVPGKTRPGYVTVNVAFKSSLGKDQDGENVFIQRRSRSSSVV